MNRLYDFTEEYLQAFDAIQIDEESGEVLGLDELETLNAQLEDKLEAVACYIKELERLAGDIKAEEANLAERRQVLERKALRLKYGGRGQKWPGNGQMQNKLPGQQASGDCAAR